MNRYVISSPLPPLPPLPPLSPLSPPSLPSPLSLLPSFPPSLLPYLPTLPPFLRVSLTLMAWLLLLLSPLLSLSLAGRPFHYVATGSRSRSVWSQTASELPRYLCRPVPASLHVCSSHFPPCNGAPFLFTAHYSPLTLYLHPTLRTLTCHNLHPLTPHPHLSQPAPPHSTPSPVTTCTPSLHILTCHTAPSHLSLHTLTPLTVHQAAHHHHQDELHQADEEGHLPRAG